MEVRDRSMVPTLLPGNRLLVDLAAYRRRPPEVGEVVVLLDPADPSRWLVKRVVGVGPGRSSETVTPWVPDLAGPSPTDALPPRNSGEMAPLPARTVYLRGDAAGEARDSRHFGAVPFEALVGRVYRRYAPVDRRGDL